MFNFFRILPLWSDWALLAVRVVLGAIFIVHGLPKLKNLKQTGASFSAMGFKPGAFWGPLVAVLEFFGGILLLGGFFTQLVALLFAIEFAVITVWKIKGKQPFVGNLELDLIILAGALLLFTRGAPEFSLDRLFFPY